MKTTRQFAVLLFGVFFTGWVARAADEPKPASPEATQEIKILGRTPHTTMSAPETGKDRSSLCITSQEDLVKLVGEDGAASLPKLLGVDALDFSRHTLLYVYGGERPTGGWKVETLKIVSRDAGSIATVYWTIHKPTGFTTQVITYPSEIVLIDRFEGEVKFEAAKPLGGVRGKNRL